MTSTAASTLLLDLRTASRRYFVPRSHIDLLGPPPLPGTSDARGRPLLVRDLGPLLDPLDQAVPGRCQALTVTLRRRSVALLVQRVESLAAHTGIQPLAPFLARRLRAPWVLGAVAVDDGPVLILDLRRIAIDLALGATV